MTQSIETEQEFAMDIYEHAVEASWEEYDEYMIRTGQWLTEYDYNAMMEAEYVQQMHSAYSYDYELEVH